MGYSIAHIQVMHAFQALFSLKLFLRGLGDFCLIFLNLISQPNAEIPREWDYGQSRCS